MKVLGDVRVLDLGSFITGPYAAMLLADLGADVIKVERPGAGDPFRGHDAGSYSHQFQAYNRHKRSITLDYSKPEGRSVLMGLVKNADVVVVNTRPGVADDKGIGFEALQKINPRLIYCAITGFGREGPYSRRPAFDTVGQSLSGWITLFHTGDDPRIAGPAVTDAYTGLFASYGILGALYERERSGRGRLVEVNMLEATLAFATEPLAHYFTHGENPQPYSRAAVSQTFVFRCADDKRIGVHMSSPEKFWTNMVRAVDCSAVTSDPRFSTRGKRVENYAALGETLAAQFRKRTRDDWMARLEACDVPFAPVHQFDEVADDPQVAALDSFLCDEHPQFGPIRGVRRPVHYDGNRDIETRPPPALGEHTEELLTELGLDNKKIAELRGNGIV